MKLLLTLNYFNMIKEYESQYKDLLWECLSNGVHRNDRTGIGSKSIFNASLKIDVSNKFPLVTGRKMFQKTFDTEFQWFINGETNIKRFIDAGVKIWDSWADENGDLGPVYGYQMRNFNNQSVDQMQIVIENLMASPDGRRHIISLWNPVQLDQMALPPCYLYFQFFVEKGKLNMFVVQRSGDMFLGIPYDIALFTKILLYVAEKTDLEASLLEVQIVDAHIYDNQHVAVHKYLEQENFDLPEYINENGALTLINYKHGPVITAKVAI
jgi:thymidylate synthase